MTTLFLPFAKFTTAAIASACLVYALTVTWPWQQFFARDPKNNSSIIISFDASKDDLGENESGVSQRTGEKTMSSTEDKIFEMNGRLGRIEGSLSTIKWVLGLGIPIVAGAIGYSIVLLLTRLPVPA